MLVIGSFCGVWGPSINVRKGSRSGTVAVKSRWCLRTTCFRSAAVPSPAISVNVHPKFVSMIGINVCLPDVLHIT